MKKKILIMSAVALFATGTIYAQKGKSNADEITFGVRAGINFQNINGKDENGNSLDDKIVTRFHFGGNVEIPLAPDFYLQPGLLFSTKGSKATTQIGNQSYTAKLNLSYLEVPVNLLYKPELNGNRLLLGFGPYLGIGLGGKYKVESGGQTLSQNVKFKNTVSQSDPGNQVYIRPLDAGANFLVGYELTNNFSAQFNAQLGLVNINPKYEGVTNDKSKSKNTGFGISLGYRFGK